jgi:hypothetical protein
MHFLKSTLSGSFVISNSWRGSSEGTHCKNQMKQSASASRVTGLIAQYYSNLSWANPLFLISFFAEFSR